MNNKIKNFAIFFCIILTTSIQAQNTYLYWDLEAVDGAEDALVEIFDNYFEENEITRKSGGWAIMRNAIGGDNTHTHRIIIYGDIYNWGYTEERETPDLEFQVTLNNANNLIKKWTRNESGYILYTGETSFENYPYRALYEMKVDDPNSYTESFIKMVESSDVKEIMGDRPMHMGAIAGGINDGLTHWVYVGFENRNDYLQKTYELNSSASGMQFREEVRTIRTVEKTSTEILVKEYN